MANFPLSNYTRFGVDEPAKNGVGPSQHLFLSVATALRAPQGASGSQAISDTALL